MAAATSIQPGWYSIEGAAIYTGFSVPSIRTAIRLGRFPARRVPVVYGGSRAPVRIKREHLDAWIEGQPLAEVAPGRIELSPEQLAELAREIVRQIRMAESRL